MTYVFALLLLTGPHISFTEVGLPFAAILAAGFRVAERKKCSVWALAVSMSAVAALIVLRAYYSEHGFYEWENAPQGHVRWTGRKAQSYLECDQDGTARLSLRVIHRDLHSNPVVVDIHTSLGEVVQHRISAPANLEIDLKCPKIPHIPGRLFEERVLRYELSVSRVWMPRRYGLGEDARLLGVQVFTKNLSKHGNWLPGRM
jgi:hypothetical protein